MFSFQLKHFSPKKKWPLPRGPAPWRVRSPSPQRSGSSESWKEPATFLAFVWGDWLSCPLANGPFSFGQSAKKTKKNRRKCWKALEGRRRTKIRLGGFVLVLAKRWKWFTFNTSKGMNCYGAALATKKTVGQSNPKSPIGLMQVGLLSYQNPLGI